MNEFLTWLLDAVQSVDPLVRTLVAGFAMMLETSVLVGLVVPGDTIVIVAATAVASPQEAILLGVAVVIGALIGESIGFWLGRVLGPEDPGLASRPADRRRTSGSARSGICSAAAARRSSCPGSCRCCTPSCP